MTTRRRMVYELDEVDKRKTKSEAGKAGGRGNEKLTQDCVSFKVKGDHHARASSAATAAVVGVSTRVVEQALTRKLDNQHRLWYNKRRV